MTSPENPRWTEGHPGHSDNDRLTQHGRDDVREDWDVLATDPRPTGAGEGETPEEGGGGEGSTHSNISEEDDEGDSARPDAKESGKQVAQDAKESGKDVARTAQEEVRNVASTASEQVRSLFGAATSEVSSQAGTQQQRLAEGLRSLAEQFGAMADGTDSSSQARGLVQEASQRTQGLADWLEQREPGDVLAEVKGFARRRPGAFIAIAAGIGLLAGRLTRGLTSDKDEDAQRSPGYAGGDSGSYDGPHLDTGGRDVAAGASYGYGADSAGLAGGPSGEVPGPAGARGSTAAASGPVDPGPMSGIGAGGTPGVVPEDLDPEAPPVYGQGPR